ncbi:hypothetical protein V1L52_04625 [Treponema sp. HNW]|uniref:hypothetical protein n=1 Tax=Treponema sp. HNW TaxID=3116654 RepID=UPI003D103AE8
MTKNIAVKISIIIAAVLFVSASKPSLDGRALVASPGELPPGLYVKTAAFLPGDTVLITNPAAKVSIEALVFGTFSPSEGVAVVLSPEAADILFIVKDSNSIVQLTKNGRDTERSVLAKAFDALPQADPAAKNGDDSVLYEEYVKAEADPVQELPSEAADPAEDRDTASESASHTVFESSEAAVVEPVPEPAVEKQEAFAEPSAEIAAEGEKSVFTPFADKDETDTKHIEIAETAQKADEEETEVVPPAEEVFQTVYDEPLVETPLVAAAGDTLTEKTENGPELVQEPEPELYAEDAVSQPEASEVAAEPEPDEAESEPELVRKTEFELEPNILIAAEEKPPVFEDEGESVTADVSSAEESVLPDYFTYSDETEVLFAEKPVYGEPADPDTEPYLIDSLSALGAGSYCIQLATYKSKAYIAEIIEKYADKYPVKLLQSEKVPEAYQVLIGPLNKDEYPVILKRFVSRGFKDAFLRTVR